MRGTCDVMKNEPQGLVRSYKSNQIRRAPSAAAKGISLGNRKNSNGCSTEALTQSLLMLPDPLYLNAMHPPRRESVSKNQA